MTDLDKFIGKKVLITVAFGSGMIDAGSIPQRYTGILEKIDVNYFELSDLKVERRAFTSTSFENYSNYAIINKNYVIMMAEA